MPRTSKSRSTAAKLAPVHPGEILKETLQDLGISMNRLSQEIHVPANRISSIVAGQRAITGETPSDWGGISIRRRNTGSTCRRATTWRPRATSGQLGSSLKSGPVTLLEPFRGGLEAPTQRPRRSTNGIVSPEKR